MDRHLETERKFDVDPDQELPGLVTGPVAAVGQPTVTQLEATYLDTVDLALAAAKVTLRRRTGGEDAGWHLKLPRSGDTRTELRRPLGGGVGAVPEQLLDEVRDIVGDQPVGPVAVLRTTRTERRLLDAGGTTLAVVADDSVDAERLSGDGDRLRWREIEVELVDGDATVLDAVGRALAAAGIAASTSSSKLARVLGTEGRRVPDGT